MPQLLIPGQPAAPERIDFENALLSAAPIQSITTDARRSGDAPQEIHEEGDIVLLEFEGGIHQWVAREELTTVLEVKERRGEVPVLALHRRGDRGRRGVGKWLLKKLLVFKIDPVGIAAEKFAKMVDSMMCKRPGLLQGRPAEGGLSKPQPNLPSDKPLLLFIHGTASNTVAGFGGLVEAEQLSAWQALTQQYSTAPLFFNHPTLSKSPLENAIDLIKELPHGAKLHLVTHSRGGLVGDALCLGEIASGAIHDEVLSEVPHLKKLLRELDRKKIRVHKFVRVACPARGTILASERLDDYLNILTNLAGKTFGLNNPYTAALRSFLLAVIARRKDPGRVPGIEAMIPGSPIIRFLNTLSQNFDSSLTVLAGDVEGAGFAGRLKVFMTDAFYLTDHDLVVDTKSMYGGLKRQSAQFYFRSGSDVDHFNYFRRKDFVDALRSGLGDDSAGHISFRQLSDQRRGIFPRDLSKPTGKRPAIFVLPGLMGSHLHKNDSHIWLNYFRLAAGGFRGLTGPNITAPKVIHGYYGKLAESFDGDYDVYLWPYDWRLSLRKNAELLARDVRAALNRSSAGRHPIRFIAHSMGGLVVRTMLAQDRDVWDEAAERPGSRILFLGTPNEGSLQILRVLNGDEGIVQGLHLADLFGSRRAYTDQLAEFPGMCQLLPPPHAHNEDFSTLKVWKRYQRLDANLSAPSRKVLSEARKTWALLADPKSWDLENMYYVAGWARLTPKRIDSEETTRLRILVSGRGDGRVLWEGGVLPKKEHNYYTIVSHGKLPEFKDAFAGYRQILEEGETRHPLLSQQPFGVRGEDDKESEWEEVSPPLSILPDESDLLALAMGDQPDAVPRSETESQSLRVHVVHGDLFYARHTVMLGHYEGDHIVGSEEALNRRVGHALEKRHDKDAYPGPVGSSLVYFGSEPNRGALIVGLGQVGSLSVGSLAATVERGVKEYAFRYAEQGETGTSLSLSTIVIGSGESGLPRADALAALVEGVLSANRALAGDKSKDILPVCELEIIELYQDAAIEAAHHLRSLARQPRFRGVLEAAPRLSTSQGDQERAFHRPDEEWWRRLQILDQGGYLRYNTFLQRARAESYDLKVLRSSVEGFVRTVETDYNYRPEVSSTLFELMVPNEVKIFASDRHNLMLLLDSHTATLPWEMLRDRREKEGEPLCVRAGMIRQLSTGEFRAKVDYPNSHEVLVIGDPPTHLAALPGARAEAGWVTEALERNSFRVTSLIARPVPETLPALMNQDYKVLHFSGHGEYEPDSDEPLGMVIGEHYHLTPAMVNQLRSVPEFVFLNCCYLGSLKPSHHRGRLAANLAEQFIRMGVRAVIAAGWAVDDSAANYFAQEFYSSLLSGESFGEAVLHARKATYDTYPGDTTWGAFQAYGDPTYRLKARGDASARTQAKRHYVSPQEPILDCRNLAQGTTSATSEQFEKRRAKFEAIEDSIPEEWLKDSALLSALGYAAAQLTGPLHGFVGHDPFHAKALKYLDAALKSSKVSLSLEVANLLEGIRLREAFFSGAPNAAGVIKAAIERRELIAKLKQVESLGAEPEPNAKAESRIGGGYFQLAQLTQNADDLLKMLKHYQRANDIQKKTTKEIDPYYLHYALSARLVLKLKGEPMEERFTTGEFTKALEKCRAVGTERYKTQTHLFDALVMPRGELLLALHDNTLEDKKDSITEGFEKAYQAGGTPYEFRSVLEFIYFFEKLLGDRAVVEVLREIRVKLQEIKR